MARHATRQGVLVLTSDKMPAPTPITEKPKKIQEVAAEIRSLQPDDVEGMANPCYWEDLHQYFHPIDLWYKGASNLLEVVFRLLKENQICMWVESWLTWEQNRYRLSCWDTTKDIMSVFGPSDWDNIYAHGVTFPKDCVVFFCDQLKYWYHYYRNPDIMAVTSPSTMATIPPAEDTLPLDCQGAPVVLYPFARVASASIQATAPDFIPSIRRSSGFCDKPAASEVEIPIKSEHVQKANKIQHKASKSGPIPKSELSKLQVETGIAGPSRLPNKIPQQMPAYSKSSTTLTKVPLTGIVFPSKSQLGNASPQTQTRDRITSGRFPNQPASVPQAQGQQKKKGTDQKPQNGWSHSRNDPIHGPIRQHHKQVQDSSNTSAQEPAANSILQCPNLGKMGCQAVWEPFSARSKLKAVEDYLRRFGSIEGSRASWKPDSKTIAYVTFRKEEDAVKAVKVGNGAQIQDDTGFFRLQLEHPWVTKHWRYQPQQREAEIGLPPTMETAQLHERTPSVTSSQKAGYNGSGGSAGLRNARTSRHPFIAETDPFVGGNPTIFSSMLASSYHPHHPHHPPCLQHPQQLQCLAPSPYRVPAPGNTAQPVPFHPAHMHYTSPSHVVPTYPLPPPFGSGLPTVPPVVPQAPLPGLPRTHLWPQGLKIPNVHHQPRMPMVYTPWPEQPPHGPHPGGPHQHGHMPIHLGQRVGPSAGPRAVQMANQSSNQTGHSHIEHHQGKCSHAQTKQPAEVCLLQEEELPSSSTSNLSSSHRIPVRLPSSRSTSQEIRLEQERASAPQQGSNGEDQQAGIYQEGRGHHETYIKTGTVIRYKSTGRQVLPSQWFAQVPRIQDKASPRNSDLTDVIPPMMEPEEADKEQNLPGNGKGKKKPTKKKKKENYAHQAAKKESQLAPVVVADSKSTQASQDESKKVTKKKKKPVKRGPSAIEQAHEMFIAPVESAQAGNTPVESARTPETTIVIDKNESVSAAIMAKPYRADAGGSLHVFRQRYKPAIRDIFKPHQDVKDISGASIADNTGPGTTSSSISHETSSKRQDEPTEEQIRKKIHGSFSNLDVGFNPWPRAPSGEVWSPSKRAFLVASTSNMKRSMTPQLPQVIIEPAVDTVTEHGLPTPTKVAFKDTVTELGLRDEIDAHYRGTDSKKPSGSSFVSMAETQYTTVSSYHSARSTFSSGENTPHGTTPPASPSASVG
ncbi:uncharacterized protein B0T23DRAFT_406162 [Neurospora hispaniola]|uniref:RRM domain-containing protein n=1 Tax=Neurospora hispaniola TaxID=588809 RepID=A0AAJ0I352_9PEZI|nr:hypothetical protein B0T23DRAFT_406162 [Neurospora hispaniola]